MHVVPDEAMGHTCRAGGSSGACMHVGPEDRSGGACMHVGPEEAVGHMCMQGRRNQWGMHAGL